MKHRIQILIAILATAFITQTASAQTPIGTAITYQGQLKQSGLPVNTTADFQFTLWDALAGGNQVGPMIAVTNKSMVNGLFTVTLDFGATAFAGNARWLEIAVCTPSGCGTYTTLAPRQEVTPAPHAIFATTAGVVPGGVSGGGTVNTVSKFLTAGSVGDSILRESGGKIGIGLAPAAKLHLGGTPGTDGLMFPDGTLQTTAAGGGFGAWGLRGNAGTNPPADYFGTSDNQALEIKVNGARALRLEPTGVGEPNVIAGAGSNSISAGVTTSNIGGGANNHITWSNATIGGGILNTASMSEAVVSGGAGNTASGAASAVLGGAGNVSSGDYSTATGGLYNTAFGNKSTVPGGESNYAAGTHSLAAGYRASANHDGAFVWADHTTGPGQWASTGANQFLVKAAGGVGINTAAPATALHVVGNTTIEGTLLQDTTGPGNAQLTVFTATGTLNATGDFTVTIPPSLYYNWGSDNYVFKVEVFVTLDPAATYPDFGNRGSAYQMEIVGKERGASLTHFTELHKVANDATFNFTYSASGTDLVIAVDTNRASGKEYRVTVKIWH